LSRLDSIGEGIETQLQVEKTIAAQGPVMVQEASAQTTG
jgi:hypothetical protein